MDGFFCFIKLPRAQLGCNCWHMGRQHNYVWNEIHALRGLSPVEFTARLDAVTEISTVAQLILQGAALN